MITPQDKRDIDQALDEVEEAIRRHNQWLEEQITKLESRQKASLSNYFVHLDDPRPTTASSVGVGNNTNAIDDKCGSFYIRGVSEDGADMPLAVTRHGPEQANARLIAAAPSLAATVESLIRNFVPSRDKMTAEQKIAFDAARTILTNATCELRKTL